jgi:hypothetical protein
MSTHQRGTVRQGDLLYHGVLLSICCCVLLLACVLSVRSATQVVVPLLGMPLPELCFMRRFTGLACPGCGLTRCFISLAHGNVAAAWSFNPAGLLLFAIIALQVPYRLVQLWRIRQGFHEIEPGVVVQLSLGGFAIALVGQWALRMLGVAL